MNIRLLSIIIEPEINSTHRPYYTDWCFAAGKFTCGISIDIFIYSVYIYICLPCLTYNKIVYVNISNKMFQSDLLLVCVVFTNYIKILVKH